MAKESPSKVYTDQDLRSAINHSVLVTLGWWRTHGYSDARNAALRSFAAELAKCLVEEMTDKHGAPLWSREECLMVLQGASAIVTYGDIFPEKQRSLLGALKKEKGK